MKLRLASSHLSERFHKPLRFGRRWRGHELALRLVQLAVLVVIAAVGARLIAGAVTMATRTIASLVGS